APVVRADGGVTDQRLSENGLLPIEQIPGFDRDLTLYDVGFDASWELDLFGRTRRAVEAAGARLDEADALRRGARMTVAAEVARVYLELRGAQRRLEALHEALAAARRTRDLVELQVQAGEVAAARLAQVEADLTALDARVPALEGEIRATVLSLGVLMGDLPESELGLLEPGPAGMGLPAPLPLPALPVGERAELLRRRPDVRAAERRLAAATAGIGVATAELFPRLSIGAAGGFQAMTPGDLVRAGSETWALGPLISWRIFDGGRVRAEIRAAEARTEAAALGYEQAVREALGDAERALTRYRHGLEALDRQAAAVDAARRNREYARLRHEAGEAPLFELLDADRTLARARETYAEIHTRVATGLVALFKALGGGWEGPRSPEGDAPAARPAG
ncbi:MAG: TolC family protein, partial [Acidobacteriota bacterium]